MSVAGNYHHLTEKPEAGDALILHSPPQTQNPYPPPPPARLQGNRVKNTDVKTQRKFERTQSSKSLI